MSRGFTAVTGIAAVAVVAAVLGVGAEDQKAAAAEPAMPNIVLVILDDARRDDLTAAPAIKRRVGDQGATLNSFYASFPLCCPARATLLTGQYPHNHRVLSNVAPNGGWSTFRDASTLATWLTPTYQTGHVGKYLNQYKVPYLPPGWDEWMVPKAMYDYTGTRWFLDNGRGGGIQTINGYQTDTIGALASRFVTRNAPSREPFFLHASIVAPHAGVPADPDDPVAADVSFFPSPYVKPAYRNLESGARLTSPAFNEADVSDKPIQPAPLTSEEIRLLTETYQQRREAMRSAGDAVARILDAVDASGEAGNTYVMVTSDNGFILGEHRYRGGKLSPFEVSNHVPFLVKGPGIVPGTSIGTPTAQVDVAPTVLAMAGLRNRASIDGINLLPALRTGVPPSRRGVLLEAAAVNATTTPPPWHYRGVVAGRWKYVERASGVRELYNLSSDPEELVNVADRPAHAETQRSLAELLAQYRGCARAGCR